MKRIMMHVVCAIMGFLLCASSAQAQWYAGASLGKQASDMRTNQCGLPGYSCKNDDMVGTVVLRYRVYPLLSDSVAYSAYSQIGSTSIELAYTNYGKLNAHYVQPSNMDFSSRLYSFSLGSAYELRVTPCFSLTTRLGVSSFKLASTDSEVTSRSTDLYYGIGTSYHLSDSIALTGDLLFSKAPSLSGASSDIRNLSAGVIYSF